MQLAHAVTYHALHSSIRLHSFNDYQRLRPSTGVARHGAPQESQVKLSLVKMMTAVCVEVN